MSRDVLKGLQLLRSLRIVHCDLKPENILLGETPCIKEAAAANMDETEEDYEKLRRLQEMKAEGKISLAKLKE